MPFVEHILLKYTVCSSDKDFRRQALDKKLILQMSLRGPFFFWHSDFIFNCNNTQHTHISGIFD